MTTSTPERATYPLVNTDDVLVMVWRDHITQAAFPVLYLQGIGGGDVVGEIKSGPDLDIDAFTDTQPVVIAQSGVTVKFELPSGVFNPLNKVSVLRLTKGRVAADLRSFGPMRTYFRQPTELAQTTRNPGGWPSSP